MIEALAIFVFSEIGFFVLKREKVRSDDKIELFKIMILMGI